MTDCKHNNQSMDHVSRRHFCNDCGYKFGAREVVAVDKLQEVPVLYGRSPIAGAVNEFDRAKLDQLNSIERMDLDVKYRRAIDQMMTHGTGFMKVEVANPMITEADEWFESWGIYR